jgi:phospholipase C
VSLAPIQDYLMGLSSGALESEYTWRLFPKIHEIPGAKERFMRIADFHRLARAGQLPRFSFIEPSWTISKNSVDPSVENLFTQMGTDYHPPGNLIVAERFVKEIYASLIADPAAWNKTLLLITFDEFVGSFDHVAPPPSDPALGAHRSRGSTRTGLTSIASARACPPSSSPRGCARAPSSVQRPTFHMIIHR